MNSKIDTLRQMVAAIGKTQAEYHEFFPGSPISWRKNLARTLETRLLLHSAKQTVSSVLAANTGTKGWDSSAGSIV